MTDNAFERNTTDKPLFSEDDLPLFEQIQRALPDEGVDDAVNNVMAELPPTKVELEGIKRNIERLEGDGLWATARFYKRLLEKREAQEG